VEEKKKVAFYTLGCKLNYSESSSISRQFIEQGYSIVDFDKGADLFVINTCSVTDNADKKCRRIIHRALKNTPSAKIIVIGCYAQLKPAEISTIPGVCLILGTREKFNIIDHLKEIGNQPDPLTYCSEIEETDSFNSAYSFGQRTRTFLKVQDGCDYSCSFCTIPMARGKSRSDTIENILNSAKKIAKMGAKEVVLSGVNIGDFGKGTDGKEGNSTLLELIKQLDSLDGISRFRISSIEPNLLSDDIIKFVAQSGKFMDHFHIPLQSGSNRILQLMRRRYKRELYLERVNKIKSLMPHCCIGADVITGFPGERDEDFQETYDFLKEIDVSYLHVFAYSERSDTDALQIEEMVPVATRKKRSKLLRNLSLKKNHYFYEQQIGKRYDALFEEKNEDGFMNGFTENYIKVRTVYDHNLTNEIMAVHLDSIGTNGEMDVTVVDKIVSK